MPTIEEIKFHIKSLSVEEKLAIGEYATSEGIKEKKQEELKMLLDGFPDLIMDFDKITDSDKVFIEKNKDNKDIKRDKIKFTETSIELDGLKFPRNMTKYEDIKNVKGLKINTNVYQKYDHDYFTFDVINLLENAGYKVPSKDQRQKAADVFGGDFGLLGQLFNYPKAGIRRTDGRFFELDTTARIWSSTIHSQNKAYDMIFSEEYGILGENFKNQAISLILLQD